MTRISRPPGALGLRAPKCYEPSTSTGGRRTSSANWPACSRVLDCRRSAAAVPAPSPRGPPIDLRRSVRHSLRYGGDPVQLRRRIRVERPRPTVLIVDVSGSMAGFSRALVQFSYGMSRAFQHVEVFCFGTRLTRLTNAMRVRDPNAALDEATDLVVDWDGGTRIGESLRAYVNRWGKYRFNRGAVVIICSTAWSGRARSPGMGHAAPVTPGARRHMGEPVGRRSEVPASGQSLAAPSAFQHPRRVLRRVGHVTGIRESHHRRSGKRGGKPCIRGLRITVFDVLDCLASGVSGGEILADFPDLSRPFVLGRTFGAAAQRVQNVHSGRSLYLLGQSHQGSG